MILDTEILEYIFSKYKDKERDLNEQYLYPIHLVPMDPVSSNCAKILMKKAKLFQNYWTAFTRAGSYMEECKDPTEALRLDN